MLPAYTLIIDIVANDPTIDEQQFRTLCDPSLSHLDALQGAFERKPNRSAYYPPGAQQDIPAVWSARGVVLISVGKARSESLIQLYQAIVHLIALELPDFEVRAEIDEFQFS